LIVDTAANNWKRVSRAYRCPVCDKPDWCVVSVDGEAAICQRVKSSRHLGSAGYLHRLADPTDMMVERIRRLPRQEEKPDVDWDGVIDGAVEQASQCTIDWLIKKLDGCISARTFKSCRCGAIPGQGVTFPMYNGLRKPIGVRIRGHHRKWAVRGSTNGLFIGPELSSDPLLLITEGESDMMAAAELGFHAIGRSSCSMGADELVRFIRANRWLDQYVIVSDADDAGRTGAERLRKQLELHGITRVRVIEPATGGDLREWIADGAGSHEIRAAAYGIPDWP